MFNFMQETKPKTDNDGVDPMTQFLALIEKLGTEINAQNIGQFVDLIEKLTTLAETIKADVDKSGL